MKIEYPVKTPDSFGGVTTVWTTFADNVPAAIEQMKAFDKAAVNATWPGADSTIIIRYLSGLNSTMRISFNGMIYSILGQPNDVDGRHREMILTCESGVKAA